MKQFHSNSACIVVLRKPLSVPSHMALQLKPCSLLPKCFRNAAVFNPCNMPSLEMLFQTTGTDKYNMVTAGTIVFIPRSSCRCLDVTSTTPLLTELFVKSSLEGLFTLTSNTGSSESQLLELLLRLFGSDRWMLESSKELALMSKLFLNRTLLV